jgi:Tol biopolymer transport system component
MTYIAAPARAGAPSEVVLANADGSAPRALGPASTAVLSPNGTAVAAVRTRATARGSLLLLYSPSRKAAPRVLRSSSSQMTIVAWSPDGEWIAVIDGDTLVAVPLHGAAHIVTSGTINGASFAPDEPDRLVFAKADSVLASAAVNLYTVSLGGGRPVAITHDGLSEYPLWGPSGIVFSRELSRSTPTTYQLWSVAPSGRGAKQLTNLTLTPPFYGLEPIAFSANGKHLLANLVGDNATEAWTVDLTSAPAVAHDLGLPGTTTIGNSISRDGSTILLTEDSGNPTDQAVAMIPWAGGTATTLAAHGAFASWNR